jgi:hypothetical protein
MHITCVCATATAIPPNISIFPFSQVHTHASGALFVLQGMTPETFISKLGYNAQAAVVHR